MKMIKLITVTALTVGAVFGTIVESAEARGGRWSINSFRGFDSNYEFSLFTETPEGEEIFDSQPNRQDWGIFKGAIQNFNYTVTECCTSPEETPEILESDSFDVLDLRASIRQEWGLTEYSVINSQTGRRESSSESSLFIEYSFINPKTGRNEFIPPGSGGVTLVDFAIPLAEIPKELDPVNSLKDIFTLFSLKNDQTGQLLIEKLLFQNWENEEMKVVKVSVPESDISNSLLILGVVGAGWGLQRKLNRKS
jgi:hypothetical protein